MATNFIVVLMPNGSLIRTYTNSLYSPQGLTFSDDGNLLLSESLDNQIVLFDITTAKILQVYSSSDPLLASPSLVTVLSSRDIYVNSLTNNGAYSIIKKLTMTNSSANVTQIIDPKPHFGFPVVSTLNNNDSRDPAIRSPNGISIDLQGNLYVADSGNSRVIKLLVNATIIENYKMTPPLQFPYDVKVRNDKSCLYI
ncbi:unnamed protein product [Rotaria socialis]